MAKERAANEAALMIRRNTEAIVAVCMASFRDQASHYATTC